MERRARRPRTGILVKDRFLVEDGLTCDLRAIVSYGQTSSRRIALYDKSGRLTRVINQRLRNRFRHSEGILWKK